MHETSPRSTCNPATVDFESSEKLQNLNCRQSLHLERLPAEPQPTKVLSQCKKGSKLENPELELPPPPR